MSSQDHPAVRALNAVLDQAAAGADVLSLEVESLTAHRYGGDNEVGYLVSLRGSSPFFSNHHGRVQKVDLVSIPLMDAEVMVEFKKTGGVIGANQELKLSEHNGTLTVEDAATLRSLLGEVDFFEVTEDSSGSTRYDGFSYIISAAHGRRYRRIAVEEGLGEKTIAQLRPLISWLEARLPAGEPRLVLD